MLECRGRNMAAWGLILCAFVQCCMLLGAADAAYTPTSFNVCGNQFTDGGGATWYGKSFISPSSAGAGCNNASTIPITVGTACSPTSGSTICSQSQLQQMLQAQAMGPNLTYTSIGIGSLGKKNTTYAITLYFVEFNATAIGERVFNILINGQTVATDVDIYALAGGDYSAVSFAAPAFYSGSRSNFDIALPMSAGTASILTGMSFQLATSTSATLTPMSATWGDTVLLEIYSNSLSPAMGNLTGNYDAYLVGGFIRANTTTAVIGGAGGSLMQAYGNYTLNTTLLTNCNGGTVSVTVIFNDPKELYGNSIATVNITLSASGACSVSTTAPVTTSAPPTTTAAPPTTTVLVTTSAAPVTSANPTTTATPMTSTSMVPTSSLAPPTSESPMTTASPDTSSEAPGTTAAPPSTTLPAPSTSAAPTTSAAPPGTTPAPTSSTVAHNVTMQMAIYPDPPIAGGQTIISGEATSDDGIPPTGTVAIVVDGSVIGTTPLVPVNGTSSTPLVHVVDTGQDEASTVLAQSSVPELQRAISFAAIGRSIFSYTFLAPSTPGDHTIMVVAMSGGTTIPISAPVVSNFTVAPPANMTLTFDGNHAIGTIGPAHRCKAFLMATANVTGPTNADRKPTGNVTLAITNADPSLLPVHLTITKVLNPEGKATYFLNPSLAANMLGMVGDLIIGKHTTIGNLLPGTYNASATYNGDGTYPPATACAELLILPSCLLTTIVMS